MRLRTYVTFPIAFAKTARNIGEREREREREKKRERGGKPADSG
jgi:hypothetical protein